MIRLFLWLPWESFDEEDGFETNASFDDKCGILVESENTFFEKHSADEPSIVEFSEVTYHMEFSDLIHMQSTVPLI